MVDKPPFAVWAPSEIARLREQADSLERALHLYLGNSDFVQSKSLPRGIAVTNGVGRRSKYEEVFAAFERERRALTLDDMIAIAQSMGFEFNRSNMRSQVFAQKKAGRAHPRGDGYIWGLSDNQAAPLNGEAPLVS